MPFNPSLEETQKVQELLKNVLALSDESIEYKIEQHSNSQPVVLALTIGFKQLINAEQLNELKWLSLLIWEYYKDFETLKEKPISVETFMKQFNSHNELVMQFRKTKDKTKKDNLAESALSKLKSQALFLVIANQFKTFIGLSKLPVDKKGLIQSTIINIIHCLDQVGQERMKGRE